MAAALLLLAGMVRNRCTVPTGFIPSQDSGFVFGVTMAGQDISFESMARHHRAVADILARDPNVVRTGAFLSEGNQGFVFATLRPRPERQLSVDQVMEELRP